LSLLTGGLEVWKLAKDGLLALVTVFAVCLVWMQQRSSRLFNALVLLAAAYMALHVVLWLLHPAIYAQSAWLGLTYNGRVVALLLLGMSAGLLWPEHMNMSFLLKFLLGVSTVVALLGVVQWFLPHDFLSHVGYGLDRGTRPIFYIDNKSGFPRVMSTLREPNALGAYLILPVTALVALLFRPGGKLGRAALAQGGTHTKARDSSSELLKSRRLVLLGMLGLHGLALVLTFSRSSWLGALVSVGLILVWLHPAQVRMFAKRFGLIGTALVVMVALGVYSQRHSSFVRSYITHSSTNHNRSELDSNALHQTFVERGLRGIADNPIGHGPGTAGLASIQNPKGSFLTENYYVQIGYEVGVLGLALFVVIQMVVYARLWARRRTLLPAVLLTSFWGYVLTNMLLHTWSNEAVVTQWWLVAGLSLAPFTAVAPAHQSRPGKSARA
jgi:hypothetical protein